MKIKTLDIYGYGKWVQTRFVLDDQIQLFYGKNEAGKSTLQSFIRSILFGFPTRRKRKVQQNRYEPKDGDSYGGRILLTDTSRGDLWVERTDKGLRITDTQSNSLPEETLKEILGGLNEELFDTFYAFDLDNLQELNNMGAEDLNDFFLSIGTVGSDRFLMMAKDLEKETDELYKPQGKNPPLNQQLNEYEETQVKLSRLQSQMARYQDLTQAAQAESEAIDQLNQEISQLEQAIRDQDQLLGRYDNYLKSQGLERELSVLTRTDFPPEAQQKMQELQQVIKSAHEETAKLQERQHQLQDQKHQLTRLSWATKHQDERRQWKQAAEAMKETQAKIEQHQARIEEAQVVMRQLADRGQFYPDQVSWSDEYQARVESGIDLQARQTDLANQLEALRAERKILIDQRKEQQNNSAILRQQVAKLESKRVNDEELLFQSTALNRYFPGVGILIVGGLAVAYHYFKQPTNQVYLWLGAVSVVLGVVWILYIYLDHRRKYQAYASSPLLEKMQELKDKDADYREQSQKLSTQINYREELKQGIDQELETVLKEQQRWLTDLGFYPTADPEIILKANPVPQYFEEQAKLTQLETDLVALQSQVVQWQEAILPLMERFPQTYESVRVLIRHVEEVEASLAEAEHQADLIDQKLTEADRSLTDQTQRLQAAEGEVDDLLQAASAQDLADFQHKLKVNQTMDQLEQELAMYQTQLADYQDQLAAIESKQDLLTQHRQLDQRLQILKDELTPHMHRRANLVVDIRQLEQDGSYQELTQLAESQKTQLLSLIREWGRKRLAMSLIYQTLKQGVDDPVPSMNTYADRIFQALTEGRYQAIKINKKSIRVRHFSDVLFEPHELSKGTLEQLYVALRLAFIENAHQLVKMPILIDDAFVNFDSRRKERMYQVLGDLSDDIQVLFFTFDPSARDHFSDQKRIDLTVPAADGESGGE